MLDDKAREGIAAAIGRIPSGLFILTAQHEERRSGVLVSWVQQVSFEPPMVSVAVAKGRSIMPLISESCRFALCQLPRNERMLLRKFAAGVDLGVDPFLGLDLVQPQNGPMTVPILANAVAYLQCEVAGHVDFEGDHDLFIGRVSAGAYLGGEPHVHLRENGFRY